MGHIIPYVAVYFGIGSCFLMVYHERLKDDGEITGREKFLIWWICFLAWPIFQCLLWWYDLTDLKSK